MERVNAGEVVRSCISRWLCSLVGLFLIRLELKMKFPWGRLLKERFCGGFLTLWIMSGIVERTHASDVLGEEQKGIPSHNFVESIDPGIKLSGYVDMGYSYNFASTGTRSDIPARLGSDSAQRGDFNLYAMKVALERPLTSENRLQAGFRVDVIVGEDANYLLDRSDPAGRLNSDQNSNAFFLEQGYLSLRIPLGNGWDFQVGRFVPIFGYEVIERPANMNVTYGLLSQQFPLSYIGVLSSYRFDGYLDGKIGVVNGSNSANNTTTGGNGDGCALIAGLNLTAPTSHANWCNDIQYSTNPENNSGFGVENSSIVPAANDGGSTGYMLIFNSWGNWAPEFAQDKLLFAFNSVLGSFSSPQAATTWYGAGVYAKYQINDWFYLAGRGEFMGSNNSGKFGANGNMTTADQGGHNTGENLWEDTLTAGFMVSSNLLLRCEYRLDWGAGTAGGNSNANLNPSTPGNQIAASGGPAHYVGAEVVYSY